MLNDRPQSGHILLAEDDEDDYILVRDVLNEIDRVDQVTWVHDGEELIRHLNEKKHTGDLPDVILLDLNMPKKDGRTALREIRADPDLRLLPIIVLTTSDSESDVITSYDLGANSYIIKPSSYDDFRETMRKLVAYWFEVVNLPTGMTASESATARR